MSSAETAHPETEVPQQLNADVSRKDHLEHRYIQLLEQRIANLEWQCAPYAHGLPPPGAIRVSPMTQFPRSIERINSVTSNGAPDTLHNGVPPSFNKDQPVPINEVFDSSKIAETAAAAAETSGPVPLEAPAPKSRNRIRIVTKRWNQDKSKWEEIDDETDPEKTKHEITRAATFRRNMDEDNERKVASEDVHIHSTALQTLLVETDIWWRDHVTGSSQPITVDAPFHPFVWRWDDYNKACEHKATDDDEKKDAREDLKALLKHIETSTALESYFRCRESILSSKKIRFEFLWTLFSHGAKVYARSYMKELQMFEATDRSQPPNNRRKAFRVSCSAFDWDGSKFSVYSYDFYIKEFAGERPINSLDVFPTEYYCNKDNVYDDTELRKAIIERGRKYCSLCTGEPSSFQCRYQGTAIVSENGLERLRSSNTGNNDLSTDDGDQSWMYYYGRDVGVSSIDLAGEQSQVIIDNYTFLKSERNPWDCGDMPPLGKKLPYSETGCVCEVCKSSPLQQWIPESRFEDTVDDIGKSFSANETRLLFLPPRLLGFALKEKVWGQFLVDNLTRIEFTETAEQTSPFWEELQLKKGIKDLLMAFVKNHTSPRSRRFGGRGDAPDSKAFDVIEGKGQGLAIMLHGPPGAGKTLTAETIALATGRPLLVVSVAEIGVEPHRAESKLSDVFADAARWEAVLLMDEADVFVEKRQKGDLRRNTLVSVLLRCLEYYDGIIILTTNRVRSIDVAVQSRIHLAIQYHELDAEQRLTAYKNRLKWVPDEEIENRTALEKSLVRSAITTRSKVNGRQIRNIITGARLLAKHKNERLTIEHLETVDLTTSSFIDSMSSLMEKHRAKNEAE